MWRQGAWRAALILVFGGLVAGLLLGEVGVRLAGRALPLSFTSRALQEPHPLYGVFHRPGAMAWVHDSEYTTFLRFNRAGVRGPELSTPADRPRVLILGDSFVEAAEVDEQDSLAAVLAERLAGLGRPVEVINAGVRGWGSAQELLYLTHEGLPLQPAIVILVFYVGNDLVDNSQELSGMVPDGVELRPYYRLQGDALVLTLPRLPPPLPAAPLLELARSHSALFNLAESGVAVKLAYADRAEVLRTVHRQVFLNHPRQNGSGPGA